MAGQSYNGWIFSFSTKEQVVIRRVARYLGSSR